MKKSTKSMRFSMLWITVAALMAVIAVLACGPAAASQQAGGGEKEKATPMPTPTLTPTPTPVCWEVPMHGGGTRTGCEEPGPPNTDFSLRTAINKHKAQSANQARGASAEPITVDVSIFLETETAANHLLEFLETNAGGAKLDVNRHGGDWWAVDVWVFRLDAGLIESISKMEGVMKMETIHPLKEEGSRLQQQPSVTPTLTAAQITHADQWHRAGFTGAGVGVGVIDSSFKDFETRVLPMLSRPVRFFCYDSDDNIVEGQLPPLPDGASFDACEDGSTADPDHGTNSAAALAEIVPDADFHIVEVGAESTGAVKVFQALDWLIDAQGPLTATMPDRSFNVKVINHSLGSLWDGPGNGMSRYGNVARRSLLAAVDYATSNGVSWVNPSGNAGVATFFKRNPMFHGTQHYLQFHPFGLSFGCNLVNIKADKDYLIQLRSDGVWSGADTNLAIALSGPLHLPQDEWFLLFSIEMQSGEVEHAPFDTLSVSGLTEGDYCLIVTKDPNDSDPEWVQLQVYLPDDVALQHSTVTGSLNNPSESANDAMFSVGAASNTVPPLVQPFSSKGPAPEPYPPDRVALDFVSGVFEGAVGTSFASPRVAGLTALVVDALGDRSEYDTPSEVAQYLRRVTGCPFALPALRRGTAFWPCLRWILPMI